MIILSFAPAPGLAETTPELRSGSHLVLIFGLGMIGHAIADALHGLGFQRRVDVHFPWDDAEMRLRAGNRIEAACHQMACERGTQLSVVWSAGKSGFTSDFTELNRENDAFEDTLNLIERLRGLLRAQSLKVHYISSAGGLFEGQQVVGHSSRPAPLRAYGEMKIHQERRLAKRLAGTEKVIYRPSSVYGPHSRNHRHGLINHLVSNGRRARVTVLDAHVMALRDYVFSGDIGQYVARRIHFGSDCVDDPRAHFLVSSRCASIFEVVGKIERVLNLKLPIRYDENFGNHRNITFRESVQPVGWHPSSLEVGIRQFLLHPAG